jgi:c-di-GMP-binding flagellar brake protein YcgR
MSIDQEDTRIELIHAEDEAKYLLRDRREIVAILKHIVTARALVSARLAPGRESYLSALIAVDDREDGVLLDASADPLQNERILRAEALDCVTQLEKVRIQFMLKAPRLVDEGGSPGFRCSLPDSLLRLQRREFYRLQTPISHSITCTVALPQADGSRLNTVLRILDISGGGVAVAVPPVGVRFEPGTEFSNCLLNLPDAPPIPSRLIVRNLFRITNRSGAELLRAGCEFADMPRGAEDAIQRYILKVERERNARERGRL